MITELAAELAAAEYSRVPATILTRRYPTLTLNEAYDIQRTNITQRISGGARVVGHKVGLTSIAMQQQMGVSEPDSGVILDTMILPNAGELRLNDLMSPRVETETAFRLSADLDGCDIDVDTVRSAVSEVFLALEVIDTRFANWHITLEDSVADNASSARVVLGDAIAYEPDFDLSAELLTLYRGDEPIASGEGRAVLRNPLIPVLWLAGRLRALGSSLRAGDLVLAGAVHASVPLEAGADLQAISPNLPSVRFRVV